MLMCKLAMQVRSSEELEIHAWVRSNRGVLKRIAHICGISQPFVSDVLRKRRKSFNGEVEAELKKAGAPGWK